MNQFDIQRIENALWVLDHYRNELQDTNVEIIIDGVSVTPWDGLKVLDLALYKLEREES
jgi:hypothetical protein